MAAERSVARVRLNGKDDHVGRGFPIDRRHVVTAAHVVNFALGREREEQKKPHEPVLLEFPPAGHDGPPLLVYAQVERWMPAGGDEWRMEDDMVVLRLALKLPRWIRPLRLSPGRRPNEVQMCGPSGKPHLDDHVRGHLMGKADNAIWQVNEDEANAVGVAPGFSGGPVWRPHTRRVVGMLLARRQGDKRPQKVVYVVASKVITRARRMVQPAWRRWISAAAEHVAGSPAGPWLGEPALLAPSASFGVVAGVLASGIAATVAVGAGVAVAVYAAGVVTALATAGR